MMKYRISLHEVMQHLSVYWHESISNNLLQLPRNDLPTGNSRTNRPISIQEFIVFININSQILVQLYMPL